MTLTVNKAAFFVAVKRSFYPNGLNKKQVAGIEKIIDVFLQYFPTNTVEQLAYILATAYHETAHTFEPVTEYGGYTYLRKKPYYPYYGRGYVQLTWNYNYARAEKELIKLGFNIAIGSFLKNPNLVKTVEFAAAILVVGSMQGWFTHKKISDYINEKGTDFTNARRVINGLDDASLIAGYAYKFRSALLAKL